MIILLARLSFHMSFYMITSTEFSHDHSSRTTEFSPEFLHDQFDKRFSHEFTHDQSTFYMSFHMIKSTEFSHEFSYYQID